MAQDALRELLTGITQGITPVKSVGEAMAPYSDPAIAALQQLMMKLFGQQQQQAPNMPPPAPMPMKTPTQY